MQGYQNTKEYFFSVLAQPDYSKSFVELTAKLFYPELYKRYFLYIHKQICSKVPISLYFVGPKRPSGKS